MLGENCNHNKALALDPVDSEVNHLLIDLYSALRLSARTNEMVYLSAERKRLLADGIAVLKPQA